MSEAARLLAHWWSRPTGEEREWWADAWDDARGVEAEFATEAVDDLRTAAEASSERDLLDEYERLLVGPGRAPCPPYESLWREDGPRLEQGRLMGAAAAEVVVLYRDLGLRVRADAHELPDHVAVEWEALAYALERDAAPESARLAQEHLAVWMPRFCRAVEGETVQPFYAALARLTPAWTAALAA